MRSESGDAVQHVVELSKGLLKLLVLTLELRRLAWIDRRGAWGAPDTDGAEREQIGASGADHPRHNSFCVISKSICDGWRSGIGLITLLSSGMNRTSAADTMSVPLTGMLLCDLPFTT
jgi:hypothetical protein